MINNFFKFFLFFLAVFFNSCYLNAAAQTTPYIKENKFNLSVSNTKNNEVITKVNQQTINQKNNYKKNNINSNTNTNHQNLNIDLNTHNKPVNIQAYFKQIELIKQHSPRLFNQHKHIYNQIERWIKSNFKRDEKLNFNLLAGKDGYSRVHLTSYYTPILKARHQADHLYKYPLYAKPATINGQYPSRTQLYDGNHSYDLKIIAYSQSLIDNFMLEVQGSGYIDFEDGAPLAFFAFDGKNGYNYTSIGRVLVQKGEVRRDQMSMQAIKNWAKNKPEKVILDLLKHNASAVFFKPIYNENVSVKGAAGIPLIAKTAVASDPKVIPTGSVLLVDVPLLNEQGKFSGKRESRLMVALDVGSAIKGQHLDIYQGIGNEAGEAAGFYNHFGRVWQIF